tara:strand:+ start:2293 stop:2625 length:333 start_codon:yes stop_codon:yes gene_type:complete
MNPLIILGAVVAVILIGVWLKSTFDSKMYDYTMDHDVIPHNEHKIPVSELDLKDIQQALKELTKIVTDLRREYNMLSKQVQTLQFAQGMRAEQLGYATSAVNSLSQVVNS